MCYNGYFWPTGMPPLRCPTAHCLVFLRFLRLWHNRCAIFVFHTCSLTLLPVFFLQWSIAFRFMYIEVKLKWCSWYPRMSIPLKNKNKQTNKTHLTTARSNISQHAVVVSPSQFHSVWLYNQPISIFRTVLRQAHRKTPKWNWRLQGKRYPTVVSSVSER